MPDLPPKYDPTGVSHQSAEETNDPLIADNRNFYKVEKWTKDGAKVGRQPRQGAGGLRGGDQASAPYGLQFGSGAKCWSGGRHHPDRPRHRT